MSTPYGFNRCVACGYSRKVKICGPCRSCGGVEFVETGGPRENMLDPVRTARYDMIRKCYVEVQRLVKSGQLRKLDGSIMCVDCGETWATCYDHRDYSKPADVAPVCHRCNTRRGPGKV